jgi:hypothetical protein
MRAKDGGADGTTDTAFRQQRLKAWQYVQRGCAARRTATNNATGQS